MGLGRPDFFMVGDIGNGFGQGCGAWMLGVKGPEGRHLEGGGKVSGGNGVGALKTTA